MKQCGILLPVFSLPSRYGIGTLGESAYKFVDFLKTCGQSIWQILPLSQTSFGDSPYQSPSAFAGNPYFIDPEILLKQGYITEGDLDFLTECRGDVDYGRLYSERYELLKRAYDGFLRKIPDGYYAFVKENAEWLDDYALFMSIKAELGGVDFHEWQREYLLRENLGELHQKYESECGYYKFIQYEFHREWAELRAYANSCGIEIMGDIPIYVSCDSADVWSNPEIFLLDESLCPTAVAGVPPDDFSKDGQFWGNPLYNWDKMRETDYAWWNMRIAHSAKLYDKIRIDHFVGFSNYFSIPRGASRPSEGRIIDGPGMSLFESVKRNNPGVDIIAEDLGMMQNGVAELLRGTGYPGMKVIQFSFEGSNNPHSPENHIQNCIVYTGTHDNPTTKSFWQSLSRSQQLRYSRRLPSGYVDSVDRIIAYAMDSVAKAVIIPMQDYMRLGDNARINTPGKKDGNWTWRLPENYNRAPLTKRIREFAMASGRYSVNT